VAAFALCIVDFFQIKKQREKGSRRRSNLASVSDNA
jgi:hypothetical protein